MNRVLLIIGGLIVGLLAALFTVPVFVDWNRYRGVFEEEASRLLGRDVRVGGRVNLRLLPTPYIRFEKVRIADTQAAVGEPLFRADDFTVWLAVSPLLSGGIEASEIELRRPVLTLVLDGRGSGNWASLAEPGSTSAFRPSRVSLDAVRITNGTIAIFGPGGDERTRLEHINGELSAGALEGPYRVTAAFASDGAPREIRLSTAKPEADGTVRLKGTLRVPETGATYTLDGQAQDVFRKVRLQGELTARLPLPKGAGPQQAQNPANGDAAFELKSLVKADVAGVDLTDIALSFEQGGRPQLAAGLARIDWREQMEMRLDLNSRWLDLDRIGGRDERTALPELIQRFSQGLEASIPMSGRTTVKLDLDQATLGGEIVSGLSLVAERTDGALRIKTGAALPGGSRLQAQGQLGVAKADALFDGDIAMRGVSFARMAKWVGVPPGPAAAARDGPFAVTGRVRLGPDQISGRGLVVQFGGVSVTGEASLATVSGQRQLSLALEGSELDVSPLVGAEAGLAEVLRTLSAQLTGQAQAQTQTPSQAGAATRLPDIAARLRIGRLAAGKAAFRDVVADLKLADGNLSMPQLKLGSDAGWSAELRGDIDGLTKPGAKGSLAFSIAAETPQALQDLAMVLELDEPLRPSARRAAALTPMRLAGRLRVGESQPGTYEMALDGAIASTRTGGTLRLEPRGESWREHRADLALTLDAADAGRLLAQLLPDRAAPASETVTRVPARLVLRGIGTPKGGLVSLAGIEAGALTGEFRGRASVTDVAAFGIEGDLRLTTDDLGQLVRLAGGRERPALTGKTASGTIAIASSNGRYRFEAARLAVAGTEIGGRVELETLPESHRLSGRIAASELSLPAMLAMLTTDRGGARAQAGAAAPATGAAPTTSSASATAWSDDVFDLGFLGGIEGQLRLEGRQLVLGAGISVDAAVIEAEAKGGKLALKLVEANAAGGKLAGSVALERAPAGARGAVEVRLAGATLEAPSGPGKADPPAAQGPLGLRLDAEGAALSPRGLVASLRGKGELTVGPGRINRMGPGAVRDAANAFVAIKGEVPPGELKRRFEEARAGSGMAIGQRTLAVEIADGVVRMAPLVLESADGRLTGTTLIDLEGLRVDSEWRLEPKAAAPAQPGAGPEKVRAALPAATLVYAGPLARLGTIEPQIQLEALEREATLRRIERETEELERLRRQDEERARLEAERQKLLEAERLRLESERAGGALPIANPPLPVQPVAVPSPVPVPAAAPTSGLSTGAVDPAGPAATPPGSASVPAPLGAPLPAIEPPRPVLARPPPPPRPDAFRDTSRSSP